MRSCGRRGVAPVVRGGERTAASGNIYMREGRANAVTKTALIAATLVVSGAAAHDWYPRECCSNVDCALVQRVEPLPNGSLRLTSRVGTTDVPASFRRQPSPDDQMHICM